MDLHLWTNTDAQRPRNHPSPGGNSRQFPQKVAAIQHGAHGASTPEKFLQHPKRLPCDWSLSPQGSGEWLFFVFFMSFL